MSELFGLDRELGTCRLISAEKAAEKYDVSKEQAARAFIESLNGDSHDASISFVDYLKDGVKLLNAAKAIIPDLNVKVNESRMPFKQMENIGNFLSALDSIGLPSYEKFQTIDLYEEKNMLSVVDTIFAFSRYAHAKGLIDDSKLLGPKLSK